MLIEISAKCSSQNGAYNEIENQIFIFFKFRLIDRITNVYRLGRLVQNLTKLHLRTAQMGFRFLHPKASEDIVCSPAMSGQQLSLLCYNKHLHHNFAPAFKSYGISVNEFQSVSCKAIQEHFSL